MIKVGGANLLKSKHLGEINIAGKGRRSDGSSIRLVVFILSYHFL